jgi:DHA1 family tetracycline resistance protein-like MFS transporter
VLIADRDFKALLPLFMVIMLDVMGTVLILPELTPLILQVDGSILPSSTPLFLRDFLYGFALAIYPLFMFISTPILGDMSDKYGRKKIILICLIISAASYFLSAYGIALQSLTVVLIGRAIAGLAAGTQPIANAAIMDASTEETKTRNLSYIVLVSSIGLIIGPLFGSIMSEKNIAKMFNPQIPFLFAGILSFINLLYLYFSFHETKRPPNDTPICLIKGFLLFLVAFTEKKFRILSLLYFSFILAWSLYFQSISWFFLTEYQFSVTQIGLFIGYIGLIFVLTTAVMARFSKIFTNYSKICFLIFAPLMAIGNLGTLLSSASEYQWLWVIGSASSNVVCYTLILRYFSNLGGEDTQGWIMGVAGSIVAMTWTVGGTLAGPLGYLNIRLPFLVAAILSLISFVLMCFYHPVKSNEDYAEKIDERLSAELH